MLKWALLASRLFVLCCGSISIRHGLSYTCFRQVCKGLLVICAIERITLPLELFSMTIWLVRPIDRIGWILAWLICPLKCISGGVSGFPVDMLYFVCGSTFGLYGSMFFFYVGLDWLVWSTFVHGYGHVKGRPKVCQHEYLGMVHKLVWCISHCGI